MAVPIYIFSAFIMAFFIFLIVVGVSYYMIRNFCTKKTKEKRRTDTDPMQSGFPEMAHKTTTDDENTVTTVALKTHTFDQILKQEERSGAYSIHPLKLPQPNPPVAPAEQSTGASKSQQLPPSVIRELQANKSFKLTPNHH